MRLWPRLSPLTLIVAAFFASVAGWAVCDLLLEHPTSRSWINRYHPAGGFAVRCFDPTSLTDVTSRALAIATAIVGAGSWYFGTRRWNVTYRLSGAVLCAFVVAWFLPRHPSFGSTFTYYASFHLIQALMTCFFAIALTDRSQQSRNFQFTIGQIMAVAALVAVAIVFAPHVIGILHYRQKGPHLPPPSQLYSTFNWWLVLLGVVAGANSIAWMSAVTTTAPKRWIGIMLACFISIGMGYLIARWYREYELFWPPNRAGSRKVLFPVYHSYMYWLVWHGIYQTLVFLGFLWFSRRTQAGAIERTSKLVSVDTFDKLRAEP